MDAERVALAPVCAECGARWEPEDEGRWRAYLTIDDELALYCPECAEREFGET